MLFLSINEIAIYQLKKGLLKGYLNKLDTWEREENFERESKQRL